MEIDNHIKGIGLSAIIDQHRQMLRETRPYTIFRRYWQSSARETSGMVRDALRLRICNWHFRPEARERLSTGFFATMVVL
jgi:hypothetical protein